MNMSSKKDRQRKRQKAKLRKQKKRKEKRKEAINERLIARLRQQEEYSDMEFKIEPPGEAKMSEIILGFARPLLDTAPSHRVKKDIIMMAVTAWNMCVIPKKNQKKVLKNFEKEEGIDEGEMAFLKSVLKMMSAYKKELYPNVNRYIFDFEFTETRDDMHLNIVSSPSDWEP